MQENHEYLVRIFARNEVGLSDPLESDEPFLVKKPTGELTFNTYKHVFIELLNTGCLISPPHQHHPPYIFADGSKLRNLNVGPLCDFFLKVLKSQNKWCY